MGAFLHAHEEMCNNTPWLSGAN